MLAKTRGFESDFATALLGAGASVTIVNGSAFINRSSLSLNLTDIYNYLIQLLH